MTKQTIRSSTRSRKTDIVQNLQNMGRGRDIIRAIENELKGGVGYGTYKDITVTRVGR